MTEPELLYLTTDPAEVPLVMPTWVRQLPVLAELIDEGHRRRAKFHSAAARAEGIRESTS